MRRNISYVGQLAAAGLVISIATIPTSSRADNALLKFANNTGATVRFYVDGQPSCAADSGSYCNDSTTVGTHTLSSRYEDPNYAQQTACEATQYYVPPDGFTWTCG